MILQVATVIVSRVKVGHSAKFMGVKKGFASRCMQNMNADVEALSDLAADDDRAQSNCHVPQGRSLLFKNMLYTKLKLRS